MTSSTAEPQRHAAARDRFLALVAAAHAAVQAALTVSSDEHAGYGSDPVNERSDDALRDIPTDGPNPSPAQRLERAVSELFDGTAVERAQVRVVG